eukprot:CAMPEP_0114139478 /NCGR_PEP_ID=MMETSP0043_2-20121206/16875_1 /TAXON_ID=464988 /ORGANISM="Hemiselmis andersenii, Strain CCMP644" /LENGTH=62 /DNA_ID=CAMNT_0001233513 /DNA_START=405 /DNA_END=590 /DNA_ORIENTATION=-
MDPYLNLMLAGTLGTVTSLSSSPPNEELPVVALHSPSTPWAPTPSSSLSCASFITASTWFNS